MASLYQHAPFVKELLSAVLAREVEIVGNPRPADVRTLAAVRTHVARRVTLGAFAKFKFVGRPGGGHFRLAVLLRGEGRAVIEAQDRSQEYVAPRARLHGALDTVDAMVDVMNEAYPAPPSRVSDKDTGVAGDSTPKDDVDVAASTGALDASGQASGTTKQYSAFKRIAASTVVTLCNYVPVQVLEDDVRSAGKLAGIDDASIDSWIGSQKRAPDNPTFIRSPGALLEVSADNLWRSKDGLRCVWT